MRFGSSAISSRPSAGSSSRSRSALHLARLALRAIAWREILKASYPGERIRYPSVFGAYVAGVGINSIVPARAGDVVKLYLIKHRINGSTYATLAPTLVAETLFDAFVAGGFIIWALAIGALPTHQVYSRLPSVDWGFFLEHARWTEIGLALLGAAAADRRDRLRREGRRHAGADHARVRDRAPARAVRSSA